MGISSFFLSPFPLSKCQREFSKLSENWTEKRGKANCFEEPRITLTQDPNKGICKEIYKTISFEKIEVKS
jgi:hypothetical protein